MNSIRQSEIIQLLAIADTQGFSEGVALLLNELKPPVPADVVSDATSEAWPTFSGMIDAIKSVLFVNGVTNKIAAIKLHRTLTGVSLKESKDWIESTFGV